MRQNNLDGNTWYPPTLLSLTFFDTKKFVNHRRFPRSKFSGTVRQQTFHRNSWYSTYRQKILRYHKLTETQKGFCTNWFGSVRQNDYDRKSWFTLRAPLSLAFFDARNWYDTIGFPSEKFKHCEIQKLSTEKIDNSSLRPRLYPKTSPLQEAIKTQNRRVPLRSFSFSVLRYGKNSTEKCDSTLSSISFLNTRS